MKVPTVRGCTALGLAPPRKILIHAPPLDMHGPWKQDIQRYHPLETVLRVLILAVCHM